MLFLILRCHDRSIHARLLLQRLLNIIDLHISKANMNENTMMGGINFSNFIIHFYTGKCLVSDRLIEQHVHVVMWLCGY